MNKRKVKKLKRQDKGGQGGNEGDGRGAAKGRQCGCWPLNLLEHKFDHRINKINSNINTYLIISEWLVWKENIGVYTYDIKILTLWI